MGRFAGALATALFVGGIAVAGGPLTPSSGATTTGSPGCGRATSTGTTTLTLTASHVRRTALLFVPASATGSRPAALVLNLHGSGSTAEDQLLFSGMDKEARRAGFLVAYPQGIIPDAQGFDWNVPHEPLVGGRSVPKGTPSDVTYLTDLVSAVEHHYCVDPHEVFATGFSGGARMASQLACDASDVVAAVAPVSGLRLPSPCPTTRAVPVLAFHGTADPVDPYEGHGQAYWTYSVPTAASRWAAHDGCTAKPLVSSPVKSVKVTTYAGCRDGAEVELYTITGEGHEWPGGPTVPSVLASVLGPQSSAIDANAVMWAFFQAHPLA